MQTMIAGSGWAVIEDVLETDQRLRLVRAIESFASDGHEVITASQGVRNFVGRIPEVAELAHSPRVRALASEFIGPRHQLVRSILFDKTPDANWKVFWHQDLTIAVKRRIDVEGFGPWSEKAGVVSVQPPTKVLEAMATVRVHLDGSLNGNAPLRVVPASHRLGRVSEPEIGRVRRMFGEHVCPVPKGGALLMRPLLLHASSPSECAEHRRVIHLDFAAHDLEGGLEWHPAA